MNSNNFFVITTQQGNEGIIFNDYHFGLKRTNKDESKMWACIKKLCKASIETQASSIIKMKCINPDGTHEIDKEPTASVSMLYDEQVKKFRRTNGNVSAVPVFDRMKSSLHHYRSSKQRKIPKDSSSIVGVEARRQIGNILSLPLLPRQEIQTAFCDIIEEFSGISSRFLKLTDYILRTYIAHAVFPPSFWDVFDLIGIRPKTNNHAEG
ncbi:unnamed protein product [Adineta ricciae]|uniref:FLYWCH-type domain-containing protein n=1 Tax=Adineta ricciae TaxID=249248 RepID=A0A814VN23_ADIRI|nr:unnamed protein product [Adineta ricciae]CAF1187644.1 unnamed protein product [Adineta ricciae]